jgi:hypothetical protein
LSISVWTAACRSRVRRTSWDSARAGGAARLDVDQARSVVLAAPRREVVDPQYPRTRQHWLRQRHDQRNQRDSADGNLQHPGQARARAARQRESDRAEHLQQARCVAAVTNRQAGDLLHEGPPQADLLVAEEATYRQFDDHRLPADRAVLDRPPVATVHPRARRLAVRARHRHALAGTRGHPHHAALPPHLFHIDRAQLREHDVQ